MDSVFFAGRRRRRRRRPTRPIRVESSRQKVNKVFAASSQALFTSSGSGFVEFGFLWNTVARVVLYDQAGAGGREGVFRRRCRCYLWHGRILAGLRRPERG